MGGLGLWNCAQYGEMFGIKETLSSKYFRSFGIFANGRGKGGGGSIFYGWVADSNTCAQWGLRDIAETHIE